MALGFTVVGRNNRLDELTTLIDAGAGAGLLAIYGGVRPANADTAITGQTKLVELTLSDPSFPAAAGGTLTANAITSSTGIADGTATWFRLTDSDGNGVIDGNVGTSGSDLNLGSTSITTGLTVAIDSFVLTAGNA